jgi:HJR/Mrr/RecB family endonuclease
MEITFHQQNLQDAVILYAEDRTGINRETMETELLFNEESGFQARVFIGRNSAQIDFMNQQDVIDAVAFYLAEEHNFIPEKLSIELLFNEEEGFTAYVIVE